MADAFVDKTLLDLYFYFEIKHFPAF